MAMFAMVTTLCARPLMAFADGDDTYWPEGPQINAPCAVVMEVNTGTVLYEKNSHEKHYPASITKILAHIPLDARRTITALLHRLF